MTPGWGIFAKQGNVLQFVALVTSEMEAWIAFIGSNTPKAIADAKKHYYSKPVRVFY